MVDVKYTIKFMSSWLCSSGLGSGADADIIAVKTADGIPYIPGKTIKGLVRENVEEYLAASSVVQSVFGVSDAGDKGVNYLSNESFFTDAKLKAAEAAAIVESRLQSQLYKTISQIKMVDGVTEDKSLRAIEAVVPCELYGTILNVPDQCADTIIKGLKLIKRLGTNRNRGYGLCVITAEKVAKSCSDGADISSSNDTEFYFKCTLKSDLIIGDNMGTEGVKRTLDYIPGSVFMGVVARKYDSFSDPSCVFHSGDVKFSDAHIAVGNKRSVKAPLTLCTTKYNKHEGYLLNKITAVGGFKSIKSGFFSFDGNCATRASIHKSLSIGVKYDRENRASNTDGMLFTNESMGCGKVFFFTITVSQNLGKGDKDLLLKGIVGTQRIGSSHSAQYGLVEIEQVASYDDVRNGNLNNITSCMVYADSRLMFVDEFGAPTCNISPKELGFTQSEDLIIDWAASNVRTYQFAPWNGKRAVRDADRWGYEKGSVFVIKHKVNNQEFSVSKATDYVGVFHQEGFGRILLNPDFLMVDQSPAYSIVNQDDSLSTIASSERSTLVSYLIKARCQTESRNEIINSVEEFITNNIQYYKNVSSSQWGRIHTLVGAADTILDSEAIELMIDEVTTEGVSREQWSNMAKKQLKDAVLRTAVDKRKMFLLNLSSKIC